MNSRCAMILTSTNNWNRIKMIPMNTYMHALTLLISSWTVCACVWSEWELLRYYARIYLLCMFNISLYVRVYNVHCTHSILILIHCHINMICIYINIIGMHRIHTHKHFGVFSFTVFIFCIVALQLFFIMCHIFIARWLRQRYLFSLFVWNMYSLYLCL